MTRRTDSNRQSGQPIGFHEPQPPVAQQGLRNDADLVKDGDTVRARFNLPIEGALPADEASRPDGAPRAPGGAVAADVGLPSDESSVWEARGDDRGRGG